VSRKLKVLHIAPQNFAGMPMEFVKMQRSEGHTANLITIYENTINFEEDIALGFRLPKGALARKWRRKKLEISTKKKGFRYFTPTNFAENIYFKARDLVQTHKIYKAIKEYKLLEYDIYHYDGGMDFFRDCRFAKELVKRGKKIVICYFGSDLRTRGAFEYLESVSNLNLTVEFDHLDIHKNIYYLFFPFDVYRYRLKNEFNKVLKIVHSPTNRLFKGTDKILKVIENLKEKAEFEFILLENISHEKAIEIKSGCDIAIDQVGGEFGGSGYGRNSLENISMGIPTITEFSPEYLEFLPENPFIHSTIEELEQKLLELIRKPEKLKELSSKGRHWAEKYHSYRSVNKRLEELYIKAGITDEE